MIGNVYAIPPQPPVEKNTHYVDAGAIEVGVEYRSLDPEGLYDTYRDDPAQLVELGRQMPEGGFVDEGVSLHVRSASDHHEYLRFDVFDGDPHYHYIHPGPEVVNNWLEYDPVANGDMLSWAIACIRHRLPAMLTEAGGGALVEELDPSAIERALAEVQPMAEEAQEHARSLRAQAAHPA